MKTRIITGVTAGAVFLGVLLLGGYWFTGLITIMAIVGYDEYIRMNKIGRMNAAALIGAAGLLAVLFPVVGNWEQTGLETDKFAWLLMFILFVVTVLTKNRTTIDQAALLFIGVIYIGFGFRAMIETRTMEEGGLFWTFFVFLCIWASDAGAYFAGKLLGRRKLWPEISPNKTVEGAIGGIVITVVVAVCFHFARPELVTIGRAAALAVIIAVVGMLGDLIQSAYKRVKGIKDTGTLLPGHGGILDRTDSWIIVFPFLQMLSLIPN